MCKTIYQDMGLLILGVPCSTNGAIDEITKAKLLEITTYMVTSNIKEADYGDFIDGSNHANKCLHS